MEFIEAPLFARLLSEYLDDDDYREIQLQLVEDPEAGDLLPGTGGFRKLAGGIAGGAKGNAAVSGSSTTTLLRTARFGSSRFTARTKWPTSARTRSGCSRRR